MRARSEAEPESLEQYQRPSVAADVAVFTIQTTKREGRAGRPKLPEYALQVLLIKRGQEPFKGHWALPGGFVRGKTGKEETGKEETLEQAAARELQEEAGVGGNPLHHLANYSTPGRDPRGWVISSTYCALVNQPPEPRGGSDAAHARLWTVDEASAEQLAFDHNEILADARQWVREQVLRSLVVREFLPETFVLAELYGVLRAVVPDYAVDLVNFRRKVLTRGIVEPTGTFEKRYSRRPAKLFRFTGETPDVSVF